MGVDVFTSPSRARAHADAGILYQIIFGANRTVAQIATVQIFSSAKRDWNTLPSQASIPFRREAARKAKQVRELDPLRRQPLHREEEGGISLTTNFHRLAPLSERGPIITLAMTTVLVPNLLASELRAMYHSIQRAESPLGKDGEAGIKVARSTRKGNLP
jgi:hypothetical protein